MFDITVTAILREHKKWIQTKELVKLIAQKRNVKERQAYNILKNALDTNSKFYEKEIIKHIFWDGNVIYGLAEFGPPTLEKSSTEKIEDSFRASLMRHYQKMLAYAEQLYLEGEWWDSRDTLRLLVHELPQPQREKIEKQFRGILYSRYFNYLEIENLIAAIIEQLGYI
jgi:hypothetical protein